MKRLLVVDDEPDVADVLKSGLEKKGFTVDVFYDPGKALAEFKAGKYDMVVSDIKMPKMNGFEMIYEMRHIDRNIRVIFLTGYIDLMKEVSKLFHSLGVTEVIQKPIGIQELANRINSVDIEVEAGSS